MKRRDVIRIAGSTVALPLAGCQSESGDRMSADIEPEWFEISMPGSMSTIMHAGLAPDLGVAIFVYMDSYGGGISVVPINNLTDSSDYKESFLPTGWK